MNFDQEYKSAYQFYRQKIENAAIFNGGVVALSRKLGKSHGYIWKVLSSGKVETLCKVYIQIKKMEIAIVEKQKTERKALDEAIKIMDDSKNKNYRLLNKESKK